MIDEETLMYVTNYKDAERIMGIIIKHMKKFKHTRDSLIVDATACIGGDTISFAKKFRRVISIEFLADRFEFLKNNVEVYKLNNVELMNGNSLEIIPKLPNIDIIYVDPPWGGKNYKEKTNLTLKLGDREIEDLANEFFDKDKMTSTPLLIVFKLPKNYDIKYLYDRLKPHPIYLYELFKMFIIVIEKI